MRTFSHNNISYMTSLRYSAVFRVGIFILTVPQLFKGFLNMMFGVIFMFVGEPWAIASGLQVIADATIEMTEMFLTLAVKMIFIC